MFGNMDENILHQMNEKFPLFIFSALFWESQYSGTGTANIYTSFLLSPGNIMGNIIFINTVLRTYRFFWGTSDDLFDTGFLMWMCWM